MRFLFADPGDTIVRARVQGQTGDERFELRVGEDVLFEHRATRAWSEFAAVVDGDVAERVSIAFLNDRRRSGYDRNLVVDWIEIGPTRIETESEEVVSTGTWRRESGCVEGRHQSEVLHCNGELIFEPVPVGDGQGGIVINGDDPATNETLVDVALTPPSGFEATEMRLIVGDDLRRAPWLPFESTQRLELVGDDGIRRVSAQFRDARGNVTAAFFDEIVLDREAPEVEIVSVSDNEVIDTGEDGTRTGSFDLAGNVSDDTTSVVVRAGDEEINVPVVDGEFTLDISAPSSGSHVYEVVTHRRSRQHPDRRGRGRRPAPGG